MLGAAIGDHRVERRSCSDLRFLIACRSATGAGAINVDIVRHSHGVTIGVKIRRQMLVVAGVAPRAATLNFGDDVERIWRLEAPLVAEDRQSTRRNSSH